MKKIKLTRGKYALVDDEDFDWLNQWKWNARFKRSSGKFYASRTSKVSERINGKIKCLQMHRMVMKCPDDLVVDHIFGRTLDNRKCKLRICTVQQNNLNQKKRKNNTSGFTGVTWHKQHNRWAAAALFSGKRYWLGLFTNKKEAAKVWREFAKEHHKEFFYG